MLRYHCTTSEESKSVRPARKKNLESLNMRSIVILFLHKMDKCVIVAICIVIDLKAQADVCYE